MGKVVVVIGAGSIGQAIARRVSSGRHVVLEEFGAVIAPGGSAVVIASQSGHRLPALRPDRLRDGLHAYQISKRANVLRVQTEAVRWGRRGARVNAISPGIVITPLARDELAGANGAGYRRMIELSPAGRAGTPDEVGTASHFYGPLTRQAPTPGAIDGR